MRRVNQLNLNWNMLNSTFVIGGNHHNTLGVIRSLGECGIKPYVIIQQDDLPPFVSRSKYINKSWLVSSDKDVLDVLLGEALEYHKEEKAVLIVCADNLSSMVDIHAAELESRYFLPGTKEAGRISYLMDKEVMSALARETGFNVPKSIAVNTADNCDINISMPWIIKPLLSKDGHKSDIERIYTLDGWKDYCCNHGASVQVQQLIDKDFEYQLIGLSLDDGNDVVIPGVSNVIRPSATSNTGFLRYTSLDDSYRSVLELSRRFLQATGYSGLFSLEMLRGKDGVDYFMEINFRNDGNAICVTAAGMNLPYIWYLYNTGGDYKEEISQSKIRDVYVMPEFADFEFVRSRALSLWTWLKDIRHTDRFMEYDSKDRGPFYFLMKEKIRNFVKKHLYKS